MDAETGAAGAAAANPMIDRARTRASAGRAGAGALASMTSSTGTSTWKSVPGPVIAVTLRISLRVASVNGRR